MNNILDYLELQGSRNALKKAVICEDASITYEDLISYSKKVGSYLSLEVDINSPIIVFMDKSIDTLLAFFGSCYAGCPYSVVNPELPDSRIKDIASVLNSQIVITNDAYYDKAKELFINSKVVLIDILKKASLDEARLLSIRKRVIDLDPLYINFTSGSTGIPKGVIISQASVIDFITHFVKLFNISDKDIIGNQAPFDFDVSVKDIYSSIFTGATLVIIPRALFSKPAALIDYIVLKDVTTLIWAVSALCLLTTFHALDYKVPDKVKKVIFSGEVMPIKHLNKWMAKISEAEFINVYGPTEITCNCTYHKIDRNRNYEDGIPIGEAFLNERVRILDDDLKEITEIHKKGTIYVSGVSLALGYFGDFNKTNENFIINPHNKMYKEYMYNTGDLAEYNEYHELVFRGRADFQIKYQGHRIELEEIERAMMKITEVTRACVLFLEEKSKLYGFYVGNIEKKELHEKLKEVLPVYMIPGRLVQKEEFILNKNGKIDRKILLKEIEG